MPKIYSLFNSFLTLINLLLYQVQTRDNLIWWYVLSPNDQSCTGGGVLNEDKDHLCVYCDFYGKLWSVISYCLGVLTTTQRNLWDYLTQFCGLGGFSKNVRLAFTIIWHFMYRESYLRMY